MAAEGRKATPETALAYLELAAKYFASRGIPSARLDAELLLAEVLATDRVGVYLRFDRPLGRPEVDAYRALVKRRGEGEPVAHLLGRREFWSRSFVVTPDVLVPRPETELLVERVLAGVAADALRTQSLRVLDLGTGSGVLAVTLAAELPNAAVTAVDVSPAALAVARQNAETLGVGARVRFVESDWASALGPDERFDVVVSNPPYVPSGDVPELPAEVRRDPVLALDGGADGLAAYRQIAGEAARLLAPGGVMLCELGAGQAAAVSAIFAAAGLGSIGCFADLAGIERVVVGSMAETAAPRAATS